MKALFLTDVVLRVLISPRATRPIQCVAQVDESLILELVGGLKCKMEGSRVSVSTGAGSLLPQKTLTQSFLDMLKSGVSI